MIKTVSKSVGRLILGLTISVLVFALGLTITLVVGNNVKNKGGASNLVSQPAAVYPDGTVAEGERYAVVYDGTEKQFVLRVPTLSVGKISTVGTGAAATVSADGKTVTQVATDAGKYSVTVSLVGDGKWAIDGSTEAVKYEWEIDKADNAWVTEPSDIGIDYGTGALDVGVAKYGTVSYALSYPHGGAPVELNAQTPVGIYRCVASVAATDNFTALTKEFDVQILRAVQEVSTQNAILQAIEDTENCRGVRLSGDVTLTTPLNLMRDFEIDLNGHTLSGGVQLLYVGSGAGDVRISNGKLVAGDSGLNVPSDELVSLTDNYYYALTFANSNARVNLENVEITANYGGVAAVGANVTLTDCKVKQTATRGAAVGVYANGIANTVGGSYDAANIALYINVAGGVVNVYGGTFNAKTVLRTKPDLGTRPTARFTIGLFRDDRNMTYHADVDATFGQNPVFTPKVAVESEDVRFTDVGPMTDFQVGSAAGLDLVSYATNHAYWTSQDAQYYGYSSYGNWNGNITLTSDIYMSALDGATPYYFTPICWDRTLKPGHWYYDTVSSVSPAENKTGFFGGAFDGQRHTIYDLKFRVDEKLNYAIGLVGYLADSSQTPKTGVLRDITLARASITSDVESADCEKGYVEGVGFFTGNAKLGSRFERLTVRNSQMQITGGKYVGGIVGYANGSDFYSCSVSGVTLDVTPIVKGEQYIEGRQVGGLAGWISNARDKGDVLNSVIENVVIKGVYQLGGLVGSMSWTEANPTNFRMYGNAVKNVSIIANRAMEGGKAHKGSTDNDDVHFLIGRIVGNGSATAAVLRSKLNHNTNEEVTQLDLGRNVTTGSTLKTTLSDGTYYTMTPNDEGLGSKQMFTVGGTADGQPTQAEVR